jgi:predicted lipid-binding transport protein (Tim44 family)
MSSQFRRHYTPDNHSPMRFYFGGNRGLDNWRLEQQRKYDAMAAKNAPQIPKTVPPGDRTVFLGLTIGLILGGIAAGVVGVLLHWAVVTIVCAVIGGLILGGLLGGWITKLLFYFRGRKAKQHSEKQTSQGKTHV